MKSLCKDCKFSSSQGGDYDVGVGTGIKSNSGFDQGWIGEMFFCEKMPTFLLSSIIDEESGEAVADVAECKFKEEKDKDNGTEH